jgi:PAS domain S-box-containing protein
MLAEGTNQQYPERQALALPPATHGRWDPRRDGTGRDDAGPVSPGEARPAATMTDGETSESAALLDILFASATAGLAYLDRDLRYVRINPALAAMNGQPVEAHLGRTVRDVLGDLAAPIEAAYLQVFATGEPIRDREIRGSLPGAPADARVWLASFYPVRLPGGRIIGAGTVVLDITERQRLEHRLRTRERQQAAVARFGQDALVGGQLRALFDQAARLVAETLEVEHASVLELLPGGAALRLAAGVGWPAGLVGQLTVAASDATLAGCTLRTRRPVVVDDVTQEARFPGSRLPALGVHSSICVVIAGQGPPFGVLDAHSVRPRRFSPDDIYFMQAIANHLATATARQEIEEARRQLATMVESCDDAIIGQGLDGTISSWNAGAERLYGWRADEAIGRAIALIVPPDRPDELPSLMVRLHRGEHVDRFETVRVTRDGRRLDVWVTLAPIRDAEGRLVGAASIGRDVTAEREMEHQKDAFFSAASHDLKSPITVIKGTAALLARRLAHVDSPETEPLALGLAKIDEMATKMTALLNELLDVTRLRLARPLELDPRPVDLVALARRAVAEYQATTDLHALRLVYAADEVVGRWDGARLERVLANLLSNAVKYSPNGGEIVVSVATENQSDADWAMLAVKDQGMGIPAADQPHIFNRFHRAYNVRAHIQGTGIGLASARYIVEQHGGSISVSSEEGAGATFTVRLPLFSR